MTNAHCESAAVKSIPAAEIKPLPVRLLQENLLKEKAKLKVSQFKSYDELPLFLNADMVAKVLGVASSTAYELMHEKDFPSVRVGNRFVVPKEEFQAWIKFKTGGKFNG